MIEQIPLELIDANPWQTRQTENPEHVEEIAHSIRAMGMMQTPAARRVDGRVQLAFGHTRFAAFKLLQNLGTSDDFEMMPLNLRELTDEQMAIDAFEENEKRRDLNPVEKARAVQKMLTDFGWTQEQLAEKLRIDRSGISNMIRMLRLPLGVLSNIEHGILPVRSAMALIPIYELNDEEFQRLMERFGESFDDFRATSIMGQMTSDMIRVRVDFYLEFLHPENQDPVFTSEPESIVVVETEADVMSTETVQVNEEQTPRTSVTATQIDIDNWMKQDVEGADNESSDTLPVHQAVVEDRFNEVPQYKPDERSTQTTDRPVQTANPAVEAQKSITPPAMDQPDPNEILFTITYRTQGVIVGVKKPGMAIPKLKYMSHLRPEDVPAVMREMGLG